MGAMWTKERGKGAKGTFSIIIKPHAYAHARVLQLFPYEQGLFQQNLMHLDKFDCISFSHCHLPAHIPTYR